MSTKICTIKEWNRICTDLLNCQVVGFPTETVYGLGIIADSQKAFDALVSLKQRPITKPMTVMVKDVAEIEKYAFVNEKQKNVMQQFMPGPITIILKAKPNLPFTMTLGQSTIGFRIPNHELTLKILKQVKKPLLVTSANLSSMPALLKAKDVYQTFNPYLSSMIDEDSMGNIASTVVDLSNKKPILYREGQITLKQIDQIWEKGE